MRYNRIIFSCRLWCCCDQGRTLPPSHQHAGLPPVPTSTTMPLSSGTSWQYVWRLGYEMLLLLLLSISVATQGAGLFYIDVDSRVIFFRTRYYMFNICVPWVLLYLYNYYYLLTIGGEGRSVTSCWLVIGGRNFYLCQHESGRNRISLGCMSDIVVEGISLFSLICLV